MLRALRFSLWGVFAVATATGCNGLSTAPWENPDNLGDLASVGPAPEPNWAGAASYLVSLFDAPQAMCHDAPGVTGFWSVNTNALVARAFNYLPAPASPTTPDPTYSGTITTRLQTLKACGCNDLPEHDGFVDHHLDPVVNKGGQIPLQPHSDCARISRLVPMAQSSCVAAGAQCPGKDLDLRHDDYPENGWVSDSCQAAQCVVTPIAGWDTDGVGQGDADLIAMQVLSRKNRGLDTTMLWQYLVRKWDGKGIKDQATTTSGKYLTYKLALLKICARVLGQPVPAGVDNQLAAAQNAQGGFRTSYDLNGEFTLDQLGDAQTTAYVTLAYRKPTADF